ncbi:FUSC family protein [Streptomyces sp. NPDC052236]|uniref:FUSC family protein n=1 Tax=Streptomyces sp. NPDC052236 TaxID=3365686 RepID=UPI0037CDCEB9
MSPRDLPAWLAHPLRWQKVPMPWGAVVRAALAAGPLLGAGIAAGRPEAGVPAALGAMLAGVNDRPGTRRTGIVHVGLPALAGATGLLAGAAYAELAGGWWALLAMFAVGLVSGAVSVTGPVSSTAGMQLMVTTSIGMGMPLPGAPWFKALCFLGGAAWLLLLRLVLRPPRPVGGALDGERAALAAVFDALADALTAVGGPGAVPARRRLTAAMDRADEALRLHRLLRYRVTAGELLLTERYAAATALCEAGVALLWEARPLPPRVAEGPRRLAAAIRTNTPPGALPAPEGSTAARAAFDRAVLSAAVAFGRTEPRVSSPAEVRSVAPPPIRRRALSAPGRRYGARVAMCVTASAAVALALRPEHWYWLPATAAFLVKPDLGPLFSRTANRFAGTALGVLVFAAAATVFTAVYGGEWWPAVVATAAGALVPVASRHYAMQTAVVTVLVLSFVWVGGDTGATGSRLIDTAIACAIVLIVGHLPLLADPGARVGHRLAAALRHTEAYLGHVLNAPAGERTDERMALRRAAYRALGEARTTADTVAAELPAQGARNTDWAPLVAAAERIVDAVTACAVRMEHGAVRPSQREAREVASAMAAIADALDGRGERPPPELTATVKCETLADVVAELHRIREVTSR